jgi:queuine tRNA-ribosyltransferase-like protein
MINAFDFVQRCPNPLPFANSLGYDGELFCDSGGYQLLKRTAAVPANEVLEIQRLLGGHFNAALDDSRDKAKNIRNLRAWLRYADRFPAFRVVPVVPYDAELSHLRTIAAMCPATKIVAIGKVAPTLGPLRRPDAFRRVLRSLRRIRDVFPQSHLHVFGVGGMATAILLFHLVDSVDSSSWIHEARYGRVRTFGGPTATVRTPAMARRFLRSSRTCQCPTCFEGCPSVVASEGIRGIVARSLHNAWVLMREVATLNESLAAGAFADFAEARVGKSPWHRSFLRYARALT